MKQVIFTASFLLLLQSAAISADIPQQQTPTGMQPADLAKQAEAVNNYVNQVLMPMFNCFAQAYNSSRTVATATGAEKLQKQVATCLTLASLKNVRAPDAEGSAIESAIRSLLNRLSNELSALTQTLRDYQETERKTGKHLSEKDLHSAPIPGEDPDKELLIALSNEVGRVRVRIANMGEEYNKLKQKLTSWVKKVQQRINKKAQQLQQNR